MDMNRYLRVLSATEKNLEPNHAPPSDIQRLRLFATFLATQEEVAAIARILNLLSVPAGWDINIGTAAKQS